MESRKTIFAEATARGRAAVAILRLSGPACAGTLRALTGRAEPAPRRAERAVLRHPGTGEVLDDALVIWFPGPASYTGEDLAELHLHGGRAVASAVAEALRSLGLSLAEPGEFTRRAFEAGKLDLTQVEAIADLVDAETAAQRRQALRQMSGALTRQVDSWRDALVGGLARLEAFIDFPEEELPVEIDAAVRARMAVLREEIAKQLDDKRRGERLREGLRVAILGPPNAGKSSLLNLFARREAAIVAATEGTTRDVIEVHLDLGGYPVLLADTAGLRESSDAIEAEGVRRARFWAETADVKVVVTDATVPTPTSVLDLVDDDTLLVVNKVDLAEPPPRLAGRAILPVSAKTGAGIGELIQRLTEEVGARLEATTAPVLTRLRHREALEDCEAALRRFLSAAATELAAEDLRTAARALGRIAGAVDVEEVLDRIFREFCIGK